MRIQLFLAFLLPLFSCRSEVIPPTTATPPADGDSLLPISSGIGVIFDDSQGHIWVGSWQEGAAVFDGKSWRHLTTKEGLPSNQIRSIQEDAQGAIWIETDNGVSSYDGQRLTNRTAQPLFGELPLGQWSKSAQDLWFGAGNREGVYRYDGSHMEYLPFPLSQPSRPNLSYHTTGMATGQNNMQWIATYEGVFGYDGQQFTIIDDAALGLSAATGMLHIRSILEDSKGRLWIGNNSIGVLLKEGDSIINFSEENGLIHPQSVRSGDLSPAGTLEHVFVIEEDRDGNIWFRDRDTGIWRYDCQSIENYADRLKHTPQTRPGAIHQDRKGDLWVGTADGELLKWNGETFIKVW